MPTVYRVQDAFGNGPYDTSGVYIRDDARRRPAPFSGRYGVREIYKEGNFYARDKAAFFSWRCLFGFETREDAIRWFGPKKIKDLARLGYTIRPVLARRVWRSRSGKQIFFEPAEES